MGSGERSAGCDAERCTPHGRGTAARVSGLAMGMTRQCTGQEIQTEVLDTVRKSQEMLAHKVKRWADAVQSVTPSIPMPNLPYSDKLPKPEEFVASTYYFAEQLLISQRKFAESMLEATKPLLGAGNGAAAKKGPTK